MVLIVDLSEGEVFGTVIFTAASVCRKKLDWHCIVFLDVSTALHYNALFSCVSPQFQPVLAVLWPPVCNSNVLHGFAVRNQLLHCTCWCFNIVLNHTVHRVYPSTILQQNVNPYRSLVTVQCGWLYRWNISVHYRVYIVDCTMYTFIYIVHVLCTPQSALKIKVSIILQCVQKYFGWEGNKARIAANRKQQYWLNRWIRLWKVSKKIILCHSLARLVGVVTHSVRVSN